MAAFFGRMFKMGTQANEYVIFDHPLDEDDGQRRRERQPQDVSTRAPRRN